VGEMLAFS